MVESQNLSPSLTVEQFISTTGLIWTKWLCPGLQRARFCQNCHSELAGAYILSIPVHTMWKATTKWDILEKCRMATASYTYTLNWKPRTIFFVSVPCAEQSRYRVTASF